jgi:lysophospholipase L1-like esterase
MKPVRKLWIVTLFVCLSLCAGFVLLNRHRVRLAADILSGHDMQQFRPNMRAFLARHWQQAPADVVVLLGASHIQSLYIPSGNMVNLGIGGETVRDVTNRLQDYPGLERARYIVLCIGSNDVLRQRSKDQFSTDFKNLLSKLPKSVPLRIAALPPVARGVTNYDIVMRKISEFNAILKSHCTPGRCTYLNFPDSLIADDGSLNVVADSGDHIHLSTAGNQRWIETLLAPTLR